MYTNYALAATFSHSHAHVHPLPNLIASRVLCFARNTANEYDRYAIQLMENYPNNETKTTTLKICTSVRYKRRKNVCINKQRKPEKVILTVILVYTVYLSTHTHAYT